MTTSCTRRILVCALSFAVAVMATVMEARYAAAGPLATTNRALNDGFGPDAGRWHGSVTIMNNVFGNSLNVEVDWAAFGPGKFQQFLDDEGIAAVDPSGSGEVTYVYRIVSILEAVPGIDLVTVGIDASDGRGSVSAPAFVATGAANEKSPTGGGDNTTSMAWFFAGNEPHRGDITSFLVFTSPFHPEFDFINVSSGLAGPVVSPLVASPSDRPFVDVPEPSSLLLALLGFGALVGCRRQAARSRHA